MSIIEILTAFKMNIRIPYNIEFMLPFEESKCKIFSTSSQFLES